MLLAVLIAGEALCDVVIETERMRLTVGDDAAVKSLVVKSSGEECVPAGASIPLFSVTQARPFNNETKLIRPNRQTTYPANRIRRDGSQLVVGFEVAPYEAVVTLKESPSYVSFTLSDFLVDKEDYDYLRMDVPPVLAFRVAQLPVKNRKNFGDWLNASWDDHGAVAVVGTCPETDISHERRNGFRILTADLHRGIGLKGRAAALIVANGREDFLDCMDRFERDYGLPLGVESRRSPAVNASIYHCEGEVSPRNIDRHIALAKKGGFRYMTLSYDAFCREVGSWGLCGDYDWNDFYPNGEADLRAVLAKIKAAGITPGLHTLHTHIGLKSRYVTPVADPRLHKTRRFTLAEPIPAAGDVLEIAVFEPTEGVTRFPPCRVLQFGGELFSYESFTEKPPYRFLGVCRGAHATRSAAHPRGEVGGVLDISEFGMPMSCYLDQDSDLLEEVGAKIAKIWACGFEYMYFDGAEGTNEPFNYHIGNSIYRLWKMLDPKPVFSEGAAKVHFSWHIQSGANAFDVFPPEVFKEKLMAFPVAQAPLSWQDMTRVNFGWWKLDPKTTPDLWEFGCEQSVKWKCPATVLVNLDTADKNKNTDACFEVMRRWEEKR